MNKRYLFIILLITGTVGIGLVLWFVLRPVLPPLPGMKTQPPALPTQVETPFDPSRAVPQPPGSPDVPVDPTSPEERERQAQAALNRQALDFAGRQGTYSNTDAFESLRSLFAVVTPELRAKLEARREQLLREYPSFGASWAQTTRTLSSDIDRASLPLGERTSASVLVQAQQIIEDSRVRGQTTTMVRIRITFVRQNGAWIPSDVETLSLAP